MKINGREIKGKNRKTLVLPREGGESIVLIAEAITDLSRMDEYISLPEPPVIQRAGGVIEKNHADPGYQDQVLHYNTRRMAWIILESLKPSNIEWDTVDEDDPKTWANWEQELRDSGFSPIEVGLIGQIVLEANALDEEKLEAARQVFLRGQAAAEKSTSGPSTQASSSPSGKPVSASE